ncbi:MAG TPA: cytochrome c [Bryobacteraceae bacterium]|nr:cytochrome c [Bryobacteraceae bacterium]
MMNKVALTILFAILPAVIVSGQPQQQHDKQTAPAQSALVARGKYIVEGVAMCEQCHTRRTATGQPDLGNWLKGGPVQIQPTYPSPHWAVRVPRIAGGPPGTDADFIRLMTKGIARTGNPPNPPMPQFHMTRDDAEAVLAYLKTLAP